MTDFPLVVEALSFRYHSRPEPAIRDVSFQLEPGEVLLVAGSSGCGKTTLARCINGLVPRSYKGELTGSVLLHGRQVSQMSLVEISQVIGTLLQDPERQIVASNVLSEIAFGPENLEMPREEIRERIDQVMQRLNMEHLRQRDTFTLSGGEKQKVALAGLLAMRPSILLLDEPLASLDPASAHEALAIFRRLADEGTTIVLIEHRVEDALQTRPDRLLYMSGGDVRYLGPVTTLPPQLDHHEVKLPASWVVERVRQLGETPGTVHTPARLPSSEPPLVVMENVSFAYGDGPTVLHDINLEIRRGDLIAVLGPNGAGKSTLVKHTIGLLKPTTGKVLIEGKDTRQMTVAQTANSVGHVFQSPTHMLFAPTVREELAFGPSNLKYSPEDIKRNVAESIVAVNWRDIRRAWIYFFIFIVVIVGVNGLLSGRGGPMSVLQDTSPVLIQTPTLTIAKWNIHVAITTLRVWFAITQMIRMFTMAILALPIPYTIDPSVYGVSFRRMGLPDKASFTMDLAFRFIPTLGRDFAITVDAQRARGYEMESLSGGIFSRLRRLAPLIVPVTMQSILTGEEVIDAMDLRAFGVRPRTWLRELRYERRDYLFIGLGVAILVISIILRWMGYGAFWAPGWIYHLPGA